MKKLFVLAAMITLIFAANNLFAGSVDALGNLSAEYARTLSRNASTDADATVYNPAGLVFMQDGFYANVGVQFLLKDYRMKDENANPTANPWNAGKEFKSDVPSIIPNVSLVYKSDDWAAFFSFNAVGGGGKLEYAGGSPLLNTALVGGLIAAGLPAAMAAPAGSEIDKLTLESIYYGFTLGGSYKFNDMFSGGLGFRYVYGTKTFDIKNVATPTVINNPLLGGLAVSGTKFANIGLTAHGFTGIASVNFTPMEELLVTLRYETPTILKWDTKYSGSALGGALAGNLGYKDGETERKDLPQVIAAGLSYRIIPDLTASLSFTYFMIKQANWKQHNGNKTNSDYSNGFDAAIALEYSIIPTFLVSAGYMYTKTGGNSKTLNDFEMALDSNSIAVGARYEPIPDLYINAGFQWAMYMDANGNPLAQNIKYSKDVKAIVVGAQYKFM